MSPIVETAATTTVPDMSIRRAVDSLLATSSDAPSSEDIAVALDDAGHGGLDASIISDAIRHHADTAPIADADRLAPVARRFSDVGFDDDLDPYDAAGTSSADVDIVDVDPDALDDTDDGTDTSVDADPSLLDAADDLDETGANGTSSAVEAAQPDGPDDDFGGMDDFGAGASVPSTDDHAATADATAGASDDLPAFDEAAGLDTLPDAAPVSDADPFHDDAFELDAFDTEGDAPDDLVD